MKTFPSGFTYVYVQPEPILLGNVSDLVYRVKGAQDSGPAGAVHEERGVTWNIMTW